MEAVILHIGMFDLQVCVPEVWSDWHVRTFAERERPCGTERGWTIRREGDKALNDNPERNPCGKNRGFVHIVLDA